VSLPGKSAVVTGASRGIGEAIARALATAGAAVTLTGPPWDPPDQCADRLAERGLAIQAVTADVTSPADVARLVDRAVTRFGNLHILVNNAGLGATIPSTLSQVS